MNFCFVSTLEIDSIFVTFDFMAIQRGLECSKSILFVGITTFFQIGRISTIFKVSSCILYEKNPFFHTYNLQQTACRYLKKCVLESLLKTGHLSDTPCIVYPYIKNSCKYQYLYLLINFKSLKVI